MNTLEKIKDRTELMVDRTASLSASRTAPTVEPQHSEAQLKAQSIYDNKMAEIAMVLDADARFKVLSWAFLWE